MTIKSFLVFLMFGWVIAGCSSNPSKTSAVKANKVDSSWKNKWQWRSEFRFEGGELEILSIKEDSISFTLSASNGGHLGDLEGNAVVAANKAVYSNNEDGDSCLIEFTLAGDSIIHVDQKYGDCSAAMGVTYSGDYWNSKLPWIKKDTITLVTLEILKNTQQDSIFRALVGGFYEDFLNTTQLTSEDDDLDSLHASVHSSAIRGLFTISENIVMIDSTNQIWAAVIKDEKVYYFTNSNLYKNKLPRTIEKWRTDFKEQKVVYEATN
jgi:hypothetical protein